MTTPSCSLKFWKMRSKAARKPRSTLPFATSIATLWNCHLSQKRHFQQPMCFETSCQVLATLSTCHRTSMHGSVNGRKLSNATLQPSKQTIATSNSPATNPSSTNSTECTTTTSLSGVLCLKGNTRRLSSTLVKPLIRFQQAMQTPVFNSCLQALSQWVQSSSNPMSPCHGTL